MMVNKMREKVTSGSKTVVSHMKTVASPKKKDSRCRREKVTSGSKTAVSRMKTVVLQKKSHCVVGRGVIWGSEQRRMRGGGFVG